VFELNPQIAGNFEAWLNLNLPSIALEGKNKNSFNEFWGAVFIDSKDAKDAIERLEFAKKISRTGPLHSWLSWLQDRFIIFTFSQSQLPLNEFCKQIKIEESWLAYILRDYFVSLDPDRLEEVNELFDMGNLLSEARKRTFEDFSKSYGLKELRRYGDEEEMMLSLEVTLFPKWQPIIKELKKDIYKLRFDWNKFRRSISIGRQLRFFREVSLLLATAGILIFGMKYANSWYEQYIVKRIKLLEPTFFGMDLTMLYRPEDAGQRKIELSDEEIEKLERIESAKSFDEIKDIRFDPESDEVVLTSVDEIPAFSISEGEMSAYEESTKGGYRDMGAGAGRNKAYRVLMASVSPNEIRTKIMPLLKKHDINPLGNVQPGTPIPGGIYFNLLVPTSELKEFIGKVSGFSDVTIFESNSREKTPAGRNRVFIWIKSI
jgi:hypothetical protein